jgi:AcrR family transcriptional regulator
MATRPKRKQAAGGRRSGGGTESAARAEPRDRIIDGFMALLADHGFLEIGLTEIAEASQVSLAELRTAFPGKLAILSAFSRRVDEAVLAAGPVEGEGAKDRLFDVLMRRLDVLAPYKASLRSLARSARRSPGLAAVLHCIAGRSQRWMQAAAGVGRGGLPGAVALEGGLLVFAETLRVWLSDDDPDMARTMKTLDSALGRGDRVMRLVNDVCGVVCRITGAGRDGAAQRAAG